MTDKEKQDYMQVQARLLAKHLIESKNRRKENSQKQIEEMAKVIHFNYWGTCAKDSCSDCPHNVHNICKDKIIAEELYNKLFPEGSVVLSIEEVDEFRKDSAEVKFLKNKIIEQTRKETAREILTKINNHLKRYAHIHKHAEEAKKSTEEYADGTPVEMESVWDVITLNKNGYDDYETMCKLEDNIRNLALSRLLQEFEKDFRLFARELGVEVDK